MRNKIDTIKSKTQKLLKLVIGNELLVSILVVALVVLVGIFLGWENNKVVPPNHSVAAHYTKEPNNPLSFMSNWDGPLYINIAHQGYTSLNSTGYFPLYPILIHFVNLIISSPLYSALLISWLCFVLAIYFYIKIVKHLYGVTNNLEPLRAVMFFVLFPSGVVLLATYTESLFAFLALGAIYFTLKKRLVPASILTLFATATHFNGLFILVLVGLMLLEQREKIAKIVLTLAIGSLGLLSYMAFLYVKYKNPFEFILAQKTNGWLHSDYLNHLLSTFNILDIGGVALIIVSIYYWWSRKKSFAIYTLLYLLIPIIGGQFNGLYRYSLMAFPFQLMLYERFRKNQFAYATMIALFGIFWGYFLLQYMGGYTGAGG